MPNFNFSEADSFEANMRAFLVAMEEIDPEMAAILIANKDKLALLVSQGSRNAGPRTEFNAAITQALEFLIASDAQEKH